MPAKPNKTLKLSHGMKSMRIPFLVYADLECLLLKQQSYQNNRNKSYTKRKAIHEKLYHFIIKKLAEEFKGEFECLGENTGKYISFSVPIKKEHDDDINKTITYK